MTNFLGLALMAWLLGCAAGIAPSPAAAQSPMRFQSNNTQRAVQSQIRQAVKPRLIVDNRVEGDIRALLTGRAGTELVTVLGDGSARVWDLRLGIELRAMAPGAAAMDVGPTGLIALGVDNGRLRLTGPGGTARLPEIDSGHGRVTGVAFGGDQLISVGADGLLKTWSLSTGKLKSRSRVASQAVGGVAANAAGTLAATTDGGGRVTLWDLAGDNRLAEFEAPGRDARIGFAGDLLIGAGPQGLTAWSVASRRKAWEIDGAVAWAALPSGDVATAGSDGLAIRRAGDGSVIKTVRTPEVTVRALAVVGGGRHLLTGTSDGMSYLWSVADGALVAQLISTKSGWAVIDRVGRYDGSSQGTTDVRWQISSAILPVENFSSRYYEPGLLAKLLAPQAAFLVNPAAVADGVAPPPEVALSVEQAAAGEAVVRVVAEDRGDGVAEVGVFVNGRPLGPDQLLSEERGDAAWTLSYRAAGLPGANQVTAVARGRQGIDGPAAAASFLVSDKPASAGSTLHVAVIGINRYLNPRDRLKHAVPDALGLAGQLGKSTKPLYSAVKTYKLIDEQATRSGIRALLDTLRAVPPQDAVVLYFAGHGALFEGDWYFIPADADLSRVRVAAEMERLGFSSAELRASTARLRAQRVVVLVDACRSGALVDTLSEGLERRQFKEASRQSGIHLLAATQRDQDAIEFDHLGHGAFTYVLLAALKGDPDALRQGSVTARGMIAYVERQLPGFMQDQLDRVQASQGRGGQTAEVQIPLPVALSHGNDFAVARPGR